MAGKMKRDLSEKNAGEESHYRVKDEQPGDDSKEPPAPDRSHVDVYDPTLKLFRSKNKGATEAAPNRRLM